jgi:superfamily II DNA or RNA helicase
MAESTAAVTIDEHNLFGHISHHQGVIPWDDIIAKCSFANAQIARKIYPELTRDLDVGKQEIPTIKLFDRDAMHFPIGLTQRIVGELEGQGVAVTINDLTVKPTDKFTFTYKGPDVREYQQRTITELLAAGRYGICEVPTGGGKTLIASKIIEHLGVRTLWVVHSVDLVHQMADMLYEYLGVTAGKLYAGKRELKTVTIATSQSLKTKGVQALMKKRKWSPDLRIEDEVHHHGAWKTSRALGGISSYYLYGFSATPVRKGGSGLLLEAGYGHVSTRITAEELTKAGYLAPVTVRVKEMTSKLPVGIGKSWQEVYTAGIVRNKERNRLVEQYVADLRAEGRQILVDIDELEHLKYLDIPDAVEVTGQMKSEERKAIYDLYRAGELDCLVGTVLREGLDLPSVGAVILAGGKKSQVQVLQQIGRGLRPSEGKTDCVVADFVDSHNGLLYEHCQRRFKTMRAVGFDIPEGIIRSVVVTKKASSASAIEMIRKRQQQMARGRGKKTHTEADQKVEAQRTQDIDQLLYELTEKPDAIY